MNVPAILIVTISLLAAPLTARAEFRAGAAAVDITPQSFPVYVNGGFLSRVAKEVKAPLFARAIVMDDGQTRLAIVVVDSCMVPRAVLDEAKRRASASTGIPVEHMLMSATHTHSAPSTFGALGTPADPAYTEWVTPRLAEAVESAAAALEPARAGAAVVNAAEFTAVRRWVRRPDRMLADPFGNVTVRANMHPGPRSPDATGPSGPEDPDLSVLAVQAADGRPLALLANFANHYVGAAMLSPDYFGMFADRIERRIAGEPEGDETHDREKGDAGAAPPPFVAMMSQGTSGDVWLWDYFRPGPRRRPDISDYTDAMVDRAMEAYGSIAYRSDITLAMAQAELPLRYRVPDRQRLEWAKRVVEAMGDRLPKSREEVYAKEVLYLHDAQATRIVLQAARIGEIGITALPNEVYALTGLKLKALSPLSPTINIELANGAEGYIPPPEQHALGGYNTWPARSAGLEVEAEPKIVQTLVQLLERVSGRTRRAVDPALGPAAKDVLASRPSAYWRLEEWEAPRARDTVGQHDGIYESGVAFYLEGPHVKRFREDGEVNRCPHFAGGRMRAEVAGLGEAWSVSMWVWNGMVTDARPVTGYLFSRGRDHARAGAGDHLGLGGTVRKEVQGKLFFAAGDDPAKWLVGRTPFERWTWHHVALVRDGDRVRVHLDGDPAPEIDGVLPSVLPPVVEQLFIGGRNDGASSFEGRLDEVAVYDRALSTVEIAALAGGG